MSWDSGYRNRFVCTSRCSRTPIHHCGGRFRRGLSGREILLASAVAIARGLRTPRRPASGRLVGCAARYRLPLAANAISPELRYMTASVGLARPTESGAFVFSGDCKTDDAVSPGYAARPRKVSGWHRHAGPALRTSAGTRFRACVEVIVVPDASRTRDWTWPLPPAVGVRTIADAL